MNPQKRAQQIEKATLKAAQMAQRRHPSQPVTREELLGLRIQAAPSWMRLTAMSIGVLSFTIGIFVISESLAAAIFLGIVGTVFLLGGIIGHPKTVDHCISALGDAVANNLVDAILKAFD